MKTLIAIAIATLMSPLLYADGSCDVTISAANFQDGGLYMSSTSNVLLPSTLPPAPFPGKPQDCVFTVNALGIPNARSFLQSNFAMAGANNANVREILTLSSAQLIKTDSISQLTFRKIRFTDGVSENSNIQELELHVRPTYSNNLVYIAGTWGGTIAKVPAFPEFLLDLNDTPSIIINWSNKPDLAGAATQLDISVPTTGYYQVIYRAVINGGLPMIQPFSSTVGSLKDQGLMPYQSKLTFRSEQECMKKSLQVACF